MTLSEKIRIMKFTVNIRLLCISRKLTHYRPNDAPQPKISSWSNTWLVPYEQILLQRCSKTSIGKVAYPDSDDARRRMSPWHRQLQGFFCALSCLFQHKLTKPLKQSLFPQNIAMAASFDTDIVYRVGRAIGTEARSIGVHGCFSPVLDLAQEPRWGRVQG